MATSSHIIDANPENFAELVVGNSMRGPVMVNFWSPRAGPCIKLWPLLEKLAEEYSGRFLLVNFNTDKYLEFSRRELAVASVPTVKMYYQQQVVDVIHGAESEKNFRAMIDRHLPRPSDPLLADAVKQYQQNRVDEALRQLRELHKNDADNPRIPLTLIKLMFREGRLEEMQKYISGLSSALRNNEEVIRLSTHAELLQAAQSADAIPDLLQRIEAAPGDIEARYRLAARYLVNDEVSACMDLLLDIVRADRNYRDDIGVKSMIAVLGLMADEDPQVKIYRQKMIDAMGS